MPFAREDLDSNYGGSVDESSGRMGRAVATLVNMEGEDDMAGLGTKPQLQWRLRATQCRRRQTGRHRGMGTGEGNTVAAGGVGVSDLRFCGPGLSCSVQCSICHATFAMPGRAPSRIGR
jgi:hypothetical protein